MADVIKYRDSMHCSLMNWKAKVTSCQNLLSHAPSAEVYNVLVEDLRKQTVVMVGELHKAEELYTTSQTRAKADVQKLKDKAMSELDKDTEGAISSFLDEAAASIYARSGDSCDMLPFIANAGGVAAMFHSISYLLSLNWTDLPLDIHVEQLATELGFFSSLTKVLPSLYLLSVTIPGAAVPTIPVNLADARKEDIPAKELDPSARRPGHIPALM